MTEQIHYPLIFSYGDKISGNGFLASVKVTGKALATEEDGLWWMSGVQPGGLLESGATPNEAFLSFRQKYGLILFDIAEEAHSFDEFKNLVEKFFGETNESEENLWAEAHSLIKAGKVVPKEPFSELRKSSLTFCKIGIDVTRLDNSNKHQTSDNVSDTVIMPLAA